MNSDQLYGSISDRGRNNSLGKLFKSHQSSCDSTQGLESFSDLSKSASDDYVRTELSDMFDPAALPTSFSSDGCLSTKLSCEYEENTKPNTATTIKMKQSKFLKLKSPIKMLRKKRNPAKEDLDIFEEKEEQKPVDFLDDLDENTNPSNDTCVLAFTKVDDPKVQAFRPFSSINNASTENSGRPAALKNEDRKKSIEHILNTICSHNDQENNQIVKTPIPKPTPTNKRGKSIDKLFMSQLFSPQKDRENENVDLSIGLRLAAKDKLDIMTGSTPIKGDNANEAPSKKLIIVPEGNALKKSLKMVTQSPFNRRSSTKSTYKAESGPKKSLFTDIIPSNDIKQEILLRTSEVEPSVHQTSIPEATDLLIHARVCALMEGYDQLLETRAKAGKRWFSFGHLVGVSRKDLENMYLIAIGQKPQIPMFIGEESENLHEPPPLPFAHSSPFNAGRLGNPFENLTFDGQSLKSFPSAYSNESNGGTVTKSNFPRKKSSAFQAMKPHPSTIKSLLECTDDLVVEGYFNETIGNDNDLIEDIESQSVQVTVFSSQRQRQFIVCYRGSIGQHAKPVRSKLTYNADASGVNESIGSSYLPEMEEKIFHLIRKLTSENPFCDVVFTGHSFAGGLALIGALRCAEKYQDLTVSGHGFGVPKVGQSEFRRRAHSLSNLRLIRIEHASDIYVDLPVGQNWEHVGHTITINYSKNKKRTIVNPKGNEGETITATSHAYRFGRKDQNMIAPPKSRRHPIDPRAKKMQGKHDHEMRNYLHALEHFTHMGSKWVRSFANELGSGIVTAENEVRLVV